MTIREYLQRRAIFARILGWVVCVALLFAFEKDAFLPQNNASLYRLISQNQALLLQKWHDYFDD